MSAHDHRNDSPELPDTVRTVLGEYHEPPPTPRDRIWARIEATRTEAARRHPSAVAGADAPPGRRPWLAWGAGIAAILAVGIGLGRLSLSVGPDPAPPVETAVQPSPAQVLATAQHLSRAEVFLTEFRLDPASSLSMEGQARDLLLSTRLLLDGPRPLEPRLQALLEDLELILVQVVQLDAGRLDEELEFITDGLEQRAVLSRIRTAVPAGPTSM